ncbi:hypothetical protein [Allosphingosinicella deserti]|uniref:Bacterial Pleckstrin homology domain-containing protein n=1 Tax=Allosphingosinicella deserti TaxID=2116704 RepID=A0A2P7QSF7_9SPHN|nr:hypothetical protein [Sphingomonas deserti]PSJ40894.1 hypothetical protein C7I55_11510 [Sphingomonas deserti]
MDTQTFSLVIVSATLTLALTTGLAIVVIGRLRAKSDLPLSHGVSGAVAVPVRQLKRSFGLFGYSKNGINPKLEITSDALHFRVFKPDHWPFSEISKVDISSLPFITRLEISSRSNGQLYIDVADKTRAADFLRALPATLPYTERAAALRNPG